MMQEQQSQEQQITSGVAWKIAKPILLADYLAGRATNNMWLREVIALHLEIYGKVLKAKNFGENWREMKERVGRDWKRLCLKRAEYQEFELDTFRKHIYQETRADKETPYYWIYKKAKKKRKRRKALGLPIDNKDEEYDDPVLRL